MNLNLTTHRDHLGIFEDCRSPGLPRADAHRHVLGVRVFKPTPSSYKRSQIAGPLAWIGNEVPNINAPGISVWSPRTNKTELTCCE